MLDELLDAYDELWRFLLYMAGSALGIFVPPLVMLSLALRFHATPPAACLIFVAVLVAWFPAGLVMAGRLQDELQ